MNFPEILAKYNLLQQRLAVHLGASLTADIRIAPPASDSDELSFLRLVGWCYVLINEAARVQLNFLKQLPPMEEPGRLLPYVGRLRTWIGHNLSLTREYDLETLKTAQSWFIATCGTGTPSRPEHWRACFGRLCADVALLLAGALAACDALDSKEDGARLVEELKKRAERNWDAFRFDCYVERACASIGYIGLDVVAFRQRYLDQWRKVVSTAEDDAIDRLLEMRVQASLLEFMGNALPADAIGVLRGLDLGTPEVITVALLIIRERSKAGYADVPTLLRLLDSAELAAPSTGE